MNIQSMYFIAIVMTLVVYPMSAEEIITAKKDQPDGYYGLDIHGVLSPSYGTRIRDKASGVSNAKPDDKTGFSSPWTLLMISKKFDESKVQTEFWGELVRTNQLTSDTQVDTGTKQNPYVVIIRRASIKKSWDSKLGSYSLNFGIQELPHTYTQWSHYWDWRYIDKAPLESLGFAPMPADLGVSVTGKWSFMSSQWMISNGEGYRETQNTKSSGMDLTGRISVEPNFHKRIKNAMHLFYRKGNAFGAGGNECFEGKTSCLPDDKNPKTSLKKESRSLQNDALGTEANVMWSGSTFKWNLGLGALLKKQNGGAIQDRLQPYSAPIIYVKDSTGRSAYIWLALGWKSINILFRYERGSGNNGITGNTETKHKDLFPGLGDSANSSLPASILATMPESANNGYSSKSSFKRYSFFWEWRVLSQFRMAIVYIETKNYDRNGVSQKVYIDSIGNERTGQEFQNQLSSNEIQGIVPYSAADKQILLKTTIEF